MCNKCGCAGKGLAAFVLGAVLGVAAGVLFAPAKGETTRRKLKRWADDTYEDQKEFVMEHAEELKNKFRERVDDARERLEEGKEKVVKEFNRRKDEIAAKLKKDGQDEE